MFELILWVSELILWVLERILWVLVLIPLYLDFWGQSGPPFVGEVIKTYHLVALVRGIKLSRPYYRGLTTLQLVPYQLFSCLKTQCGEHIFHFFHRE